MQPSRSVPKASPNPEPTTWQGLEPVGIHPGALLIGSLLAGRWKARDIEPATPQSTPSRLADLQADREHIRTTRNG